jgi:hypothetical protein
MAVTSVFSTAGGEGLLEEAQLDAVACDRSVRF